MHPVIYRLGHDEVSSNWLAWKAEAFRMTSSTQADLRGQGLEQQFRKGDRLIAEGDAPTFVMILVEGVVAVTRAGPVRDGVFLTFRRPFDLLGELGVSDGLTRMATVEAVTPVRVLRYGVAVFQRFLDEHADAARAAERAVHCKFRMRQWREMRYHSGFCLNRVAHVLIDHVEEFGRLTADRRLLIDVPLRKDRVADLVAFGTGAVGVAYGTLVERGAIAVSKGTASRIEIRDVNALRAAAIEDPTASRPRVGM